MDKNAFYFAETDYDYFSILYLTEIEHKRPDIGLTLTTFWKKNYWKALMRRQYGSRFSQPHPIYCCFPNGDFMKETQKRGMPFSFTPTGTLVKVKTSDKIKSKKPSVVPLEELWERYLVPEKRSANPINGLLLELCAHPYLNVANYLMLQNDLTHWDLYYERALTLIQNPMWRAETWARKADENMREGKIQLACHGYRCSSMEFQNIGMMDKANEMWLKAVESESPLSNPWDFKQK